MSKYVIAVYCHHNGELLVEVVSADSYTDAVLEGLHSVYHYSQDVLNVAKSNGLDYGAIRELMQDCDADLYVKLINQ